MPSHERSSTQISAPPSGCKFTIGSLASLSRSTSGTRTSGMHASGDRLMNVTVDDEGCLIDIDTPADYDAIVGKQQND